MNLKAVTGHRLFKPALGAALTVLCGLALREMPASERWLNVSYDYLFRFGEGHPTNKVLLILMDNAAFKDREQKRSEHWDRRLHTQLLERLTAGQCPLVVFDVWFGEAKEAATDAALAEAMRRQGHVVLMAKFIGPAYPGSGIGEVFPPHERFLNATTNWGIGKTDVNAGETARRHWPFPAPQSSFVSLAWTAAKLAGAHLNEEPEEQWLRYYGEDGPWEKISYHLALTKNPDFFKDKIVFVGNDPESPDPTVIKEDKFCTPYTRWHKKEAVGGVKIMATTFLNLKNGDWLRRSPGWLEQFMLIVTGLSLGWGLCRARPRAALGIATGASIVVALGTVELSLITNYWFPWTIIAGGQVPCALAYALLARKRVPPSQPPEEAQTTKVPAQGVPDAPDYELVEPAFGEGAYGKVWLARNAIGQWQALKAVYQSKFTTSAEPYEREFRGIRRYKPISDKHPGLLRVDFVSRRKPEGYFYYVMELGDSQTPGWEETPTVYKPRDLASVRAQTEGRCLPVVECVRIGIDLADALDFLHRQGLTHRDVKPSNIVFVNGRPKLADVGLVMETRLPYKTTTGVGTPDYMPPEPETPGTVLADVFALGMVLYVTSTGRDPGFFPEISATLAQRAGVVEFIRLNAIILKACQRDRMQRYQTAAELRDVLQETLKLLEPKNQ